MITKSKDAKSTVNAQKGKKKISKTSDVGKSDNKQEAIKPNPEMLERISAIRTKVHETFGKVALAMMVLPRYRHQSISDLNHILLEPLIRDRVAIASPKQEDENENLETLAGVAIWASVSEDVDKNIREQIKAGVFPVRLKPEDWTSGKINWLLDVIAPNQRLTTSVITNFKQVVKEGDMRLHPIITRLVDPDVLKKMGAAPVQADDSNKNEPPIN